MQTFLPYPRFDASAAVLDDRRLGKQRVETLQILRALVWPSYRGWKNHPATAMWRGFTTALVCYGVAVCTEWERRGHADAVRASLLEFSGGDVAAQDELGRAGLMPPWVGAAAMHRSHRAALLRKLPEHYAERFADVPADLPYEWPRPLVPRWPVWRSHPLTVDQAVEALGLRREPSGCRDVVKAVSAGRSVPLGNDDDARHVAAVAALCAAGPTLWVGSGDDDAPSPPVDELRRTVTAPPQGRLSASIARPPSPDDVEAVDTEVQAATWLHGCRASALTDRARRAALPTPALVVLDGAETLSLSEGFALSEGPGRGGGRGGSAPPASTSPGG